MTAPERPEYRVEWCARCPCGMPGARWQSSPDPSGDQRVRYTITCPVGCGVDATVGRAA